MTALDVMYRYERPPGPPEIRALNSVREVYGIRRLKFNEREHTVLVEYDASRLTEPAVISLLRNAGLDLQQKLVFTQDAATGSTTR